LLRTALARLSLSLDEGRLQQLATHFAILERWNQKINLTSVRRPEDIASRHFAESLFLATLLPPPNGLFVDVGSGAGFPGLPLKVVWPTAPAVLLEPNHKKATFLKEVIRSCGLEGIEVLPQRLEEAAQQISPASLVTMRAVKPSPQLLALISRVLAPEGQAALFLGVSDAAIVAQDKALRWHAPVSIPGSQQRVILIGDCP
jgi:16S rRNA (guanine527-N7)-methyltransferase